MSVLDIKFCIEIMIILFLLIGTISIYIVLKRKKRITKKTGLVITIILCVLLLSELFILRATDLLFYHPHTSLEAQELLLQNANADELTFDTPIGKCGGWIYHSTEETGVIQIIFGGNAQTSAEIMMSGGTGFNPILGTVVAFDYPGYGKSEGIPMEYTIKKMMLSAYDQLLQREDIKGKQIIVWGYSLGTGVANYVSSKREVDGLILLAPYQNGYDLVNNFCDVFYGPVKWMFPFKMRADRFATSIKVTPVIFASKADIMVNYNSTLALSQKYPIGCDLHLYEDLSHEGFWQDDDVWENIYKYISDCTKE